MLLRLLVVAVVLSTPAYSWTTCEEQEFCTNIRYNFNTSVSYSLTDVVADDQVTGSLVNNQTSQTFTFKFVALAGDTFRLTVQDPDNPRYTPEGEALDGDPSVVPLTVVAVNDGLIVLSAGENLLVNLYTSPFELEVLRDDVTIIEVNSEQRLIINTSDDDKSLALDILFPLAKTAYGIPQHAERLSLPTTGVDGLSAFRLFNVDHYGYPVFTREAVYGAIPVLYGVSNAITSGIFWMNSAQTFVDIINDGNGVDSLFISETGALELFFFTGPTLKDVVRQYTALTGVAPLPRYYNLGYHQSRYSYMSQEDVETVVAEFDNHDFPMDVIWLDIDYTDGYKYFTWNYTAFPEPTQMQLNVVETGRRMVAIIDPHIKVEEGYFVYDQAIAGDYFIRNDDGSIFEGVSWPGLSSYVDYFDPDALLWNGNLYLLENFNDSTLYLHIWNDMNEPAVSDLPDLTIPLDTRHYGGWQHRDVHNLYGFKQTESTYGGLLRRDETKRPFILTRAHFAGSQRYAAMWTGDNNPTWEHLQVSIPMVLTASLAGLTFCGADIGGFTGNVEDELLQRWYQAGAWYPFYRGHSGSNTDRREPYLFSPEIQDRVRRALRIRYAHLPYWYTLFFEHQRTGDPVVRPLSYQYPSDRSLINIDNQWLVGSSIMVAPVLSKDVRTISTVFPGATIEYWYDLNNFLVYPGASTFTIDVDMDSVPYYYRGGSMIFRVDRAVQSTQFQRDLPYTLYVFLDVNFEATGTLYVDDWESFDYRNKIYNYYKFDYIDDVLSGEQIDADANYDRVLTITGLFVYRVNAIRTGDPQEVKPIVYHETFTIGSKPFRLAINGTRV